MPTAQGADGRDHNITGYPMWLAGAGVKKGFSYGGHRRVRHARPSKAGCTPTTCTPRCSR